MIAFIKIRSNLESSELFEEAENLIAFLSHLAVYQVEILNQAEDSVLSSAILRVALKFLKRRLIKNQ